MRVLFTLLALCAIFSAHAIDCSSGEECYKKSIAHNRKDIEKSFAYAQASCDFDYKDGCLREGLFYSLGWVEVDYIKYIQILEKSCALGEKPLCELAEIERESFQVRQYGFARATLLLTGDCVKAHELASEFQPGICMILETHYIMDCGAGDYGICRLLANHREMPINFDKILSLSSQGCAQEHDLSCILLASLHLVDPKTEEEAEKGEAIFQQICERSPEIACPEVERFRVILKRFKEEGILPPSDEQI